MKTNEFIAFAMAPWIMLAFCATSPSVKSQTVYEDGWEIEFFSSVTAPSVGVDFDSSANVYVANCGMHFVTIPVWKINPSGTPAPFGLPIVCGDSLAMDSSELLHAGSGQGEIFRIQADGTTTLWVSGGGLNNINGLDFDSSDMLYAANSSTGTVLKITPGGTIATLASGLTGVCGVAVDHFDLIYATISSSGIIYRITTSGDITQYATLPTGGACGICFDTENNLYAASMNGGNLYKVTPDLTITVFADGFDNPLGVGVHSGGDIYVTDNDAYLVYRMYRMTPTPTVTPTASSSATPTASPTLTATISPTPTSTASFTLTETPSASPSPVPTSSFSPSPNDTSTPTASITPSPSGTATIETPTPFPVPSTESTGIFLMICFMSLAIAFFSGARKF